MRICVAGAGLAGSLLAWRLAERPGIRVDLLAGYGRGMDATSVSGGAVRGYDALARQRELAIASLAELLASPVLRRWGGYQQTGFVYLPGDHGGLADAMAQLARHLPGSAMLTTAGAAFADDVATGPDAGPAWSGREDAPAVVERLAGSIVPGRLRDAVLADLAGRDDVTVDDAPLDAVRLPEAGPARVTSPAGVREYDRVVLAAGAWTPSLLRASGLPAREYRTKIISYSVCPVSGWCPPPFADDATGLYGKPAAGGGLVLGVPTAGWDVPPGQPPADPRWQERARELAAALFPRLRLGPARTTVTAVDCYCDPPVLSLRPVPVDRPGLYTFTGGSGGAAKTALAASARAAAELADPGDNIGPADTSRIPGAVRR